MATAGTSVQVESAPHILVVEQHATGKELVVREIPYSASTAALAQASTLTLDDWLLTHHSCPCRPRQAAEEELARKVEELARSNRDLEQFAFIASHDLQEPLRMVATYTQLLAEKYRGKLDANADRYIAYASEGAVRLQTLIQDLLALSRVARGNAPGSVVDSNRAVEAAIENLKGTIAGTGAVVRCEGLPRVLAEPSQLAQVFQNLISNAIKFRTEQKPIVSVQSKRVGRHWEFSVSDNGIGIALEHQDTVFVIFRRLHARSEFPGNGIGLAICRRIIERLGGRIWVESRPGEGSTFKFTLPAISSEEGETQP